MSKEIWWFSLDEIGLEQLEITENIDRIKVESLILRVIDGQPHRISYRISCDKRWFVREVELSIENRKNKRIKLNSDGYGNWTDETGKELPELKDCFDIDISATPFTNTLPINRLSFEIGQTIKISVAYFLIPEMAFQRSLQHYSYLEKGLFKFEEKGIFDGFSADIQVDENGFVTDYPQLFRKIKY